jgi:membrane-associated phospholipid phosphatase
VAFAVFSAMSLGRSLRQLGAGVAARGANWLWCLGILYSTVATGQHVLADVAAGAVLGTVAAMGHLKWVTAKL